jgi:hypothetical protein
MVSDGVHRPLIGWTLLALAVAGLVAVGVGALVAPRMAASQYGIVVDDPRALAFVRAMAVRDLVIGVLLGLMATSGSRGPVAWGLYVTAVIALVDLAVVTIARPVTAARDEAPAPAIPPHICMRRGRSGSRSQAPCSMRATDVCSCTL